MTPARNCWMTGFICLIAVPHGSNSGTTKYHINNCTNNGTFRKSSTYALANPDAHLFGSVRITPRTEPMQRALIQEVEPTAMVTFSPDTIQSRYVSLADALSRN